MIGTGCHVIGTGCILGRASRTKETLLDFREWCRVTRHPRVFRWLMGCQRDPREWGVTVQDSLNSPKLKVLLVSKQ